MIVRSPAKLLHGGFTVSILCGTRYVARKLGVPGKQVQQWADDGDIPCLRVGKRYLFNIQAVADALAGMAARSRTTARGEAADRYGRPEGETAATAGAPAGEVG